MYCLGGTDYSVLAPWPPLPQTIFLPDHSNVTFLLQQKNVKATCLSDNDNSPGPLGVLLDPEFAVCCMATSSFQLASQLSIELIVASVSELASLLSLLL